MRRLILPIAFCILTGVILSLLVAWGLAWFRPNAAADDGLPFMKDADDAFWLVSRINGTGWSVLTVFGNEAEVQIPDESVTSVPPSVRLPTSPESRLSRATRAHLVGWPRFCLRAQQDGVASYAPVNGTLYTGLGPQSVKWGEWRGVLAERVNTTTMSQPNLVPWHPVLPGLAINSLVWSLPALLVLAAMEIRRSVRGSKGRCPSCGYPAQPGSTRCSECGDEFVMVRA